MTQQNWFSWYDYNLVIIMLLAVKKSKMFLTKYDCFGIYGQLFATLAGSGVVFLTFYENGGKL